MTRRWELSLSERLDRDGPESVRRKAARVGPEAAAAGGKLVALHGEMRRLRGMEIVPEVSEDKLADVVAAVRRGLGDRDPMSAAEAKELDLRKPPFPDTDEELKAMDERSSDEAERGHEDAAAVGESEKAAAPVADAEAAAAGPAVKRGSESDKSSSGVINLKALAADYYRQKAERAARDDSGKAKSGAAIGEGRGRRTAVPMLIAVAFGMVAVAGVLAFMLVSGRGGDDAGRPAAPGVAGSREPTISAAVGPSERSTADEEVARRLADIERREKELAEREGRLRRGGASDEELAAHAAEVEALRAEREAAAGEGATAAKGPARDSATSTMGRPRAGGSADARTGTASGAASPPGVGGSARLPAQPAASRDAGGSASSQPPPSAVVTMLGGGQGGASASRAGGERPAGAESDDEPRRSGTLAGSLDSVLPTRPAGAGAAPAEDRRPPAAPPESPPPPPPPPAEQLPEYPSRTDIRNATNQVRGAIFNCGAGQTGTITVQFTVRGSDGAVTDARVTGDFAGTAVGACAERAAQNARFPRFARATFTVPFPFVLPVQ